MRGRAELCHLGADNSRDDVADKAALHSVGLDHDEGAFTLLHVERRQTAAGGAQRGYTPARRNRGTSRGDSWNGEHRKLEKNAYPAKAVCGARDWREEMAAAGLRAARMPAADGAKASAWPACRGQTSRQTGPWSHDCVRAFCSARPSSTSRRAQMRACAAHVIESGA